MMFSKFSKYEKWVQKVQVLLDSNMKSQKTSEKGPGGGFLGSLFDT